jgi:hypothetical protein
MITSLLAFTIRLALVAAMTFGFVVLFEHGPSNYLEGAQAEFSKLMEFVNPPVSAAPQKSPNSGT